MQPTSQHDESFIERRESSARRRPSLWRPRSILRGLRERRAAGLTLRDKAALAISLITIVLTLAFAIQGDLKSAMGVLAIGSTTAADVQIPTTIANGSRNASAWMGHTSNQNSSTFVSDHQQR